MRIILASTSPRRRELLEKLDIPFEIMSKNTEEIFDDTKSVYEASEEVSYQKAKAVYDDIDGDVIVIGSDTIVYHNNKVIGKPKTKEEAYEMIKEFSGDTHEVISSLCLLIRKNGHEYKETTYDKSIVKVADMSDYEIND